MEQTGADPGGKSSDLVVLFGGRSEIGVELAKRVAKGATVILAARGTAGLERQVGVLHEAGAQEVHTEVFDADDLTSHQHLLDEIQRRYQRAISTAIVAFGVLGDQARAEEDAAHAVAVVHTDFVAQVNLLTLLAKQMKEAGRGKIVVFSSIAGVRVRRANYVYGSAKAGLDGFASGLTDALHGTGVHLLIVRSGFVIGRMTTGMKPAILSSTPDQVAAAAAHALETGRDNVWVPRSMSLLAFVARRTPRFVWRRAPR